MRAVWKGVLLAGIHLGLVLSVGGKLLYDRATRPRTWVRTGPFDPDLPIRGRYVRLRLEVPARGFPPPAQSPSPRAPIRFPSASAYLQLEGGQLIAVPAPEGRGLRVTLRRVNDETLAQTWEALAYFIPENVADPSRRPPGEELWVEVTLPKKGLPRPIRLGVKKNQAITPLEVR